MTARAGRRRVHFPLLAAAAALAVAGALLAMLYTPALAQTGPASVSEADGADLPNDNTTPGRVAATGTATGTIDRAGDEDRFAVELEAGRSYRFDLKGSPGGGGTLRDTYFRAIYNSQGRYQPGSYNDDHDGSRDSRVTLTPTESGTYYARVSGDRDETGTYTLTVTDITPQQAEQEGGRPAKPTGLSATASHDQVVLTWDDPGDTTITGYTILRRTRGTDAQGVFTPLVEDTGTAAATATYTDNTVSAETPYTYRIKAINEYGVSDRSRWFHIDTPAAPQATFVEGDNEDEQGGEDNPGGAPGHATPPGPGARANVNEGGTGLPNNTTTTGQVDVGGSATGTVGQSADNDWFKVNLEASKRYQIDVEGADTGRGTAEDPFLVSIRVQGAENVEISNTLDDASGVGDNSRVIFTPTATKKHFVTLTATGGTGTYTLSVIYLGANGASEADTDFPATAATAGRVDVGASATGTVKTNGDTDWFRVDLEASKTYQFDLEGAATGRGTLDDPHMQLFEASGTRICDAHDDGGVGLNSRAAFAPTAAGTYYLAAQSSIAVTGTYTLSVREVTSLGAQRCLTNRPVNADGPVDVPGPVRNVAAPGTGRTRVVYWDAPDETQTGAQWITKFRIYASTGAGCDGWKAAEREIEHPGFTTPPVLPDGTPTGFRYFKIVFVASDDEGAGFTIQFGVAAVNELGEGDCVGEPAPSGDD